MVTGVFFWTIIALVTLLIELFVPGLFFALSFVRFRCCGGRCSVWR